MSAAGEVGIWSEDSTEANSRERTRLQCRRPGFHPWVPSIGNGNPLQYSCLENPHGQGDWRATATGSQRVCTTKWLSTAEQASETKQSRPLTLLLTCLATALTASFCLLTSSRRTSSATGKKGGILRLLSPWRGSGRPSSGFNDIPSFTRQNK